MAALTLYFDRNCGRRLPEALRLLQMPSVGKKVVHHHMSKHELGMKSRKKGEPLFVHDIADDVWLSYVGSRDWIVFSQDRKFHKPGFEPEMFAIKQFKIGCFYFDAKQTCPAKALTFLKAYDRILNVIATTPKPFIYQISSQGRLTRVR